MQSNDNNKGTDNVNKLRTYSGLEKYSFKQSQVFRKKLVFFHLIEKENIICVYVTKKIEGFAN